MTGPTVPVMVAAVCSGVAIAVWPRDRAILRLAHLTADAVRPGAPTRRFTLPPRARARLAGGVAALAAALLLGGTTGLTAAALLAVGVPHLVGRLEPEGARRDRRRIAADLPLALDLLAACLGAGTSPASALGIVSGAVGGPLGGLLARVATALQLGAQPATAWAPLAGPDDLGWLARTVVRSVESGAPMAGTLDRAARELRQRRRCASEAAARAVAVKAVAPLGACFLPAFLLLGVVPTVWGIAATTFAGWR